MTPAENHLSPICSDQPVLSGSNSQRQAQWALRLGDAAVKGASLLPVIVLPWLLD
jgi:hypothetical protein